MLEVEFLPSTLPPQLESTTPSEDWVSDISLAVRGCVPNVLLSGRRRSPAACISCAISVAHALVFCLLAHNRAVLTASYAGTLSLQHNDLPPPSTLTFAGHDLSVLSTCYVPHPVGSEDKRWIASGGMDRVGRVWEYSVSKITPRGPLIVSRKLMSLPFHAQIPPLSLTAQPEVPAPTTLYTLSLHQAPISSVRSRPLPAVPTTATSAPHLLTAGWDGLIGLWDLTPGVNEGDADLEGADRKKKRRRQSTTVVNKVSLHTICSSI